jgi:hypothetical protein
MMNRRLLVFLTSLALGGFALYLMRDTENVFFEYCTTKAYGLPYAWKIDNCICDGRGGETIYPTIASWVNYSSVFFGSLLIVLLVPRPRSEDQADN